MRATLGREDALIAKAAASAAECRPILTGVHFHAGYIEATNGYLAAKRKLAEWEGEGEGHWVVPAWAITKAASLFLGNSRHTFTLTADDKSANLAGTTKDGQQVVLNVPLIPGNFPNVDQLYPVGGEYVETAFTAALMATVTAMAPGNYMRVRVRPCTGEHNTAQVLEFAADGTSILLYPAFLQPDDAAWYRQATKPEPTAASTPAPAEVKA